MLVDRTLNSAFGTERASCNVCGKAAEFVVLLELVKPDKRGLVVDAEQMPFYLCESHEYLYQKMRRAVDLKDYFTETLHENK